MNRRPLPLLLVPTYRCPMLRCPTASPATSVADRLPSTPRAEFSPQSVQQAIARAERLAIELLDNTHSRLVTDYDALQGAFSDLDMDLPGTEATVADQLEINRRAAALLQAVEMLKAIEAVQAAVSAHEDNVFARGARDIEREIKAREIVRDYVQASSLTEEALLTFDPPSLVIADYTGLAVFTLQVSNLTGVETEDTSLVSSLSGPYAIEVDRCSKRKLLPSSSCTITVSWSFRRRPSSDLRAPRCPGRVRSRLHPAVRRAQSRRQLGVLDALDRGEPDAAEAPGRLRT